MVVRWHLVGCLSMGFLEIVLMSLVSCVGASSGPLGGSWGLSGVRSFSEVRCEFGVDNWGTSGRPLGCSGDLLGCRGAVLGTSWAVLGRPWKALELFWSVGKTRRRNFQHFLKNMVFRWGALGPSWRYFGPSWAPLGLTWRAACGSSSGRDKLQNWRGGNATDAHWKVFQ